MGLQEFLRSSRLHFRRNHTYEIVLDPYDIYRGQFLPRGNYFQRPGKLLCLFPFPMETDPYGDIMENKPGLGKHCRQSLLLKIQFIVKGSVIFYLSFPEHSLPDTCPV